jgi:glycine/D-amino acid oxidase-like deaminating enzyme
VGADLLPHADVVVLGGGVAGLYSAAVLAKHGYSVLLIEREMLGRGQTIASQGILHGGIKYTLGGHATEASKAVAGMPGCWHAAMNNLPGADLDLRGVKTLCPAQFLWTTTSFFSRVTAKVAAAAIRTHVTAVAPSGACEGLRQATGVTIHQVEEPVIDPRSLLETLESTLRACGGKIAVASYTLTIDGERREVRFGDQTVRFSTLVLAAGEGNESLLARLGAQTPRMQRRPLNMVMARPAFGAVKDLPTLYGHCIAALSDKPRITVTTQRQIRRDGQTKNVWYIGGQIAESGSDRKREDHLEHARAEVAACLPWIDLTKTEWASFSVDRAEGVTPTGSRPDLPVVTSVGAPEDHVFAIWPTKLVFAPLVAEMLRAHVARVVEPTTAVGLQNVRGLVAPQIAPLPWDREDIQWS